MTKSEQIRLTHWRFKVLQQAADARFWCTGGMRKQAIRQL